MQIGELERLMIDQNDDAVGGTKQRIEAEFRRLGHIDDSAKWMSESAAGMTDPALPSLRAIQPCR